MTQDPTAARLMDVSGTIPPNSTPWTPVRVPAAAIEAEIARLSHGPAPAGGRRCTLIVHPESGEVPGFAPGVQVAIQVLLPGEETAPLRLNAGQVELCIRGTGTVHVAERAMTLGRWDVAMIPSMQRHWHRNDGDEPWVRLSYSNAPLLQRLGVLYVEHGDGLSDAGPRPQAEAAAAYTRGTAPDVAVADGGRIRGYEFLTDIQVVDNRPLVWPWEAVATQLSGEPGDGKRTIMLLYNPATERRNGTTHSFFATMTRVPPGSPPRKPGRGHRHSSVAINYHFQGSGHSIVDGHTIAWQAGDLLLSAPGWSEHAHFISPEGASILTIQDHPLHIGMESLIWQERMDGPILTLGSEPGQTGYVGPRQAGD
ncbi:cupin domain-containing protein [Verticiella sediminum]|uniref:Cupin domain-containing protein n=1 Tax=Verticiella sediminum TaxID=1247510 RepID=A0A556AJE4_9BURK|nr:cupin domain-containing protein [Verticiella sediminum]TSH93001.1 cupin domain-containing protein [Verticiella sediminum]